MKFALLPEHREFFREYGFILFEDLVEELPYKGRDLWRDDPKAVSLSRRFARVMAELSKEKTIQIAFDWALPGREIIGLKDLRALCFQGLAGGLLLSGDGHGIYFQADVPFVDLNVKDGQNYLLIGYGGAKTRYVKSERDPFANRLKEDGYSYGDHLNPKIHPILARL